jgi:lipopolysaccharide transport system permease protein
MSQNSYTHDIIIEPNKSLTHIGKELWQYRELFLFLAWRDILVRYKQTIIGLAWSILRPLLTMVVFTIVFGKLAKLPSGNIPYALLVYAAMIPWQFFSNTLSESASSLIVNTNLVSKVYFPRIIIPTTAMVVSFIDCLISGVIFLFLMIWYQFLPNWRILVLPILLLLAALTSLGFGYWISALNVKYRDFRYVVPFIVQFGLYISPVGFKSTVVPEKWRLLYSLNPMVGVIDGFRWALLGNSAYIDWPSFGLSLTIAISIFILGFWFFMKLERELADVI